MGQQMNPIQFMFMIGLVGWMTLTMTTTCTALTLHPLQQQQMHDLIQLSATSKYDSTIATPSIPLIGRGSSLVGVTMDQMLFAYQLANDWPTYQQLKHEVENGTTKLPTTPITNTSLFFSDATDIQTGYTPSGSGDGKSQLIAGNVDFACSDSSFSSAQFVSTPDLQMLPSLATAVVIVYNLPELNSLSSASTILLNREVLVQIFAGNITQWNDPSIASLQTPEIAALLPAVKIKVVVRLDGSGTSNIFTHALSSFSPVWAAQVGAADLPAWPTALNPIRAKLSTGVNSVVAATPYALSYSPLGDANALNLAIADLLNLAGTRVSPTSNAINAALLEKGGQLDAHSNAQLVDSVSPTGYPIVGYTYFAVRLNYTRGGSCASRALLLRFLTFFYQSDVTKAVAKSLGFETLPSVLTQQFITSLTAHLICGSEMALIEPVTPTPKTSATYGPLDILQRLNNAYLSINTNHVMEVGLVGNSFDVINNVLSGASGFGLVASRGFDGDNKALKISSGQNFAVTQFPNIGVFPMAITALVPVHSITTLSATSPTLQLDYDTMTGILLGEISVWNDSKILAINPLLDPTSTSFSGTSLPNSPITVVLYSGTSELTNIWRTQLSLHSSHFNTMAGPGSDTTKLTPTKMLLVDEKTRLQPTVSAIPNSVAFVQLLELSDMVALMANWVIHDTEATSISSSSSSIATISPGTSSMAECVPIVDEAGNPATPEATDTERMNMVSPSARVINPDNSFSAASHSYSYDAKNWSDAFSLELAPNQGNRATCWPFTLALYAVIPLVYTNLSDAALAISRQATFEDVITALTTRTAFPDGTASEQARLQTLSGSGEYGALTLKWVYWLYSGGLVSQAFSHLNLLPIPTQMRLLVRSSLEHASADGTSLLINYPTDYKYSVGLESLSYILTILGEVFCLVMAIFIWMHKEAAIVRALSVPFCFYIILGAAMQFASIPFMTISTPTSHTCNALVWLLSLGFALSFGALLLKTYRVWYIMTQRQLVIVSLDNKKLSGYLALLVSAFLALLIIWTVHAPLISTFVTDFNQTPAVVHQQCGSANGGVGQIYMWVLLAMCLALVLAATVIAILVRNVASDFNESKLLGLSIYICLILLLVVTLGVTLLWSGYLRDAYTILMIIGVFCNTSSMLGLMIGTKSYIVWCVAKPVSLVTTQRSPQHGGGVTPSKTLTGARAGGMRGSEGKLHGSTATQASDAITFHAANGSIGFGSPNASPLSSTSGGTITSATYHRPKSRSSGKDAPSKPMPIVRLGGVSSPGGGGGSKSASKNPSSLGKKSSAIASPSPSPLQSQIPRSELQQLSRQPSPPPPLLHSLVVNTNSSLPASSTHSSSLEMGVEMGGVGISPFGSLLADSSARLSRLTTVRLHLPQYMIHDVDCSPPAPPDDPTPEQTPVSGYSHEASPREMGGSHMDDEMDGLTITSFHGARESPLTFPDLPPPSSSSADSGRTGQLSVDVLTLTNDSLSMPAPEVVSTEMPSHPPLAVSSSSPSGGSMAPSPTSSPPGPLTTSVVASSTPHVAPATTSDSSSS